jgi:cytoskeletal protein CcmA (bactofilin family)
MFNNNTSKATGVESSGLNQLSAGTTIKGDIISNGDIRIDGTLDGTITTKGKLVVGPNGIVEGEVNCQNADISGTINAKITVAELLTLKATAKLNGDISTNKLAIEPGANFTGACSMGGIVKDIKQHGKDAEQRNAKEKIA